MKKNLTLIVVMIVMFTGCYKTVEPKKVEMNLKKKDVNQSIVKAKIEENFLPVSSSELEIIDSVFDEEDELGKETQSLIEHLIASAWEKRALERAYRRHKLLWTREQKKEFKQILEEDKYLSLCEAKGYWDNLMFVSSESEEDVLYSILLLKYLNNLETGCVEWVKDKVEIQKRDEIHAHYVLNLLPYKVLIERLFVAYLPDRELFYKSMKEYRNLKDNGVDKLALKAKRLEVENYKSSKSYPSYE